MKALSILIVSLSLVTGCASAPSAGPAPQHAMASCADLTSANGAPTDPNPNEVRHTDCRD